MGPIDAIRHAADATCLTGQGALVTGAGRGLGRVIAHVLAAAGAAVAVIARSADQLAATVTSIREAGGRALGLPPYNRTRQLARQP